MVKTSNKRRGDELEKHGPPPRMLLSKMLSKDLMRSAVLGFLDRLSVARFMVVEEFSRVFHLRSCFCEGHGTILGQIHTDMPASLIKQCADCEMPKIGKFRCGKCDDFSKRTHFGSCSDCEKSECNGCMFFCVKCSREFCFECKDSIHCGQCKIPFCRECRDTLHCERCEESFCLECSEVVVCVKCDKTVCNDCEWIPYCAKCNKDVCRKCREIECCEVSETGYYCEGCNKMFSCIGCKDCFHCQECNKWFCSGCCKEGFFTCEKCMEQFCHDCRKSIPCNDECEEHRFCTLGCKERYACCSPKAESLSAEAS